MISSSARKGLVVAALHLAIVSSLGARLLTDRAMRPRVWARTAPVDPDLPIRGRYVRLRIEAALDGAPSADSVARVVLSKEGDRLMATPASGTGGFYARRIYRDGQQIAVLEESLAYFIPEHVADPSRRQPGEELWVEVTLPRQGPPRPIRLGVRRDGQLVPLEID